MGHKTTRREFLKQMALTGAALTALPGVVEAAGKMAQGTGGKSRVVIATDTAALTKDNEAVQAVVEKMLAKSMTKLTDAKTSAQAWKKLFSPKDVVGIKVNCLFGKGVSTRPEVVNAVIAGLKSAGVKEDNIIVWDRSSVDLIKCGFIPNKTGPGVKYFADDDAWGPEIQQGAFKGHITTVINEKITALVNMPILKTHGITGISCCLKNHYGSFNNPGNHHGNNCDPQVADFSSIPMVKDKMRLVVVDGLRPQHSGGPGLQAHDQFNHYALMVSTDPVAADYQGLQIIQDKLTQLGKTPIPDKKVNWLTSAQERGVGTCDPKKIELLRV
jgi:uncharacterized protein (DUF362 family)